MEIAYVAGFFDGEGNVWFNHRGHRLTFFNSHREVLEQIQATIGCGRIKSNGVKRAGWKPVYKLEITRRDELLLLIPLLLSHAVVKRERLEALREALLQKRSQSPSWGALELAGADEIRRLYWQEELSSLDIARMFDASHSGVTDFMRRHSIPTRSRSEAGRIAQRRRLGRALAVA